jgi:hypothetical protein
LVTAVATWLSLPYTIAPLGPVYETSMLLAEAVGAGAVDDLGDHPVDRDRLGRGQRLGALQAGELEQLVHQPAHPRRLVVDPLGEAPGGHQSLRLLVAGVAPTARRRTLGGVEQRLGEQLQRADRGLQLVAHVRHEVAPHPGQPVRLGDVGRLDRDMRRVEGHGAQVQAERGVRSPRATTGKIKLHLAAHARASHLAGQRTQDGVCRRSCRAHHPSGAGPSPGRPG